MSQTQKQKFPVLKSYETKEIKEWLDRLISYGYYGDINLTIHGKCGIAYGKKIQGFKPGEQLT